MSTPVQLRFPPSPKPKRIAVKPTQESTFSSIVRSLHEDGPNQCNEKPDILKYQKGIGPGDLIDISEAGSKTTWLTDPWAIYICTYILPMVACALIYLFLLMVFLLMMYGAMRHWYLDTLLPSRFFTLKPLRKDKMKVAYMTLADNIALNNTGFFKWNSIRRCFRRHSVCQLHHKHRNHRKLSGPENSNDKLTTLRELKEMSNNTKNKKNSPNKRKEDFPEKNIIESSSVASDKNLLPPMKLMNPVYKGIKMDGDQNDINPLYSNLKDKHKSVHIKLAQSLLKVVPPVVEPEPTIILERKNSEDNINITQELPKENEVAKPKRKRLKRLKKQKGTGVAKVSPKEHSKNLYAAKNKVKKSDTKKSLTNKKTRHSLEKGAERSGLKTPPPPVVKQEKKPPKKPSYPKSDLQHSVFTYD